MGQDFLGFALSFFLSFFFKDVSLVTYLPILSVVGEGHVCYGMEVKEQQSGCWLFPSTMWVLGSISGVLPTGPSLLPFPSPFLSFMEWYDIDA